MVSRTQDDLEANKKAGTTGYCGKAMDKAQALYEDYFYKLFKYYI